MKQAILLLLTIFSVSLFGQQPRKIINKKNNETYYVLKSDKTIKHGEYEKFYDNKPLIKGFYKFGVKDSIWECYDFDGQTVLKYNFSKSYLVFYKPSEKAKETTYKIINNGFDAILNRNPIYLDGDYYLISFLLRNINYPKKAMEYGKSGIVYVSFTVDKHGKTSNYHVDKPIGYDLDEEAIRVLKLIPDNWLPGLQSGQSVDVEVIYPISFILL